MSVAWPGAWNAVTNDILLQETPLRVICMNEVCSSFLFVINILSKKVVPPNTNALEWVRWVTHFEKPYWRQILIPTSSYRATTLIVFCEQTPKNSLRCPSQKLRFLRSWKILTMTIKVEREALLCVLSHPPSHQGPSIPYDEWVHISCDKDGGSSSSPYVFISERGEDFCVESHVGCTRSFDDDCTVTTATSSSASSFDDDKRVSFADPLVTDVFTRPRTEQEEISALFYSQEETSRYDSKKRCCWPICDIFIIFFYQE